MMRAIGRDTWLAGFFLVIGILFGLGAGISYGESHLCIRGIERN